MKPPFKCGQCGSKTLYLDSDRIEDNKWIACLTCGNRWPGGKEPVKIKNEQEKGGELNSVIITHVSFPGTENLPEVNIKEPQDQMKKGTCSNCEREGVWIVSECGGGLCQPCHNVSKDLGGEDRRIALLNEKTRWAVKKAGLSSAPLKQKDQFANLRKLPKSEILQKNIHQNIHDPESSIIIPIETDQDNEAYIFIDKAAAKNRRTIPQQILWMIEREMEATT